jgi:hypothetical protein
VGMKSRKERLKSMNCELVGKGQKIRYGLHLSMKTRNV